MGDRLAAIRSIPFFGIAITVSLAMITTGCDWRDAGSDPQTGTIVTPAAITLEPSASPPAPTPSAAAHLKEGESLIERIDPRDLATPGAVVPPPAGPMRTRKDFVDPPLPAELKNDGGLVPLPPRPTRTTDR